MKDVVHFNKLFDCYSNMLKDEEKEMFKLYYEEDLSYLEIAADYEISKSAVGKKIKNIENKLEDLEKKLKIIKHNESLEELLNENDINIIKEKISIIIND